MPLDSIFSPAGLIIALEADCELFEPVAKTPVYLSNADLHCSVCDDRVIPPRNRPARYLAIQKVAFDVGPRCVECLRAGHMPNE